GENRGGHFLFKANDLRIHQFSDGSITLVEEVRRQHSSAAQGGSACRENSLFQPKTSATTHGTHGRGGLHSRSNQKERDDGNDDVPASRGRGRGTSVDRVVKRGHDDGDGSTKESKDPVTARAWAMDLDSSGDDSNKNAPLTATATATATSRLELKVEGVEVTRVQERGLGGATARASMAVSCRKVEGAESTRNGEKLNDYRSPVMSMDSCTFAQVRTAPTTSETTAPTLPPRTATPHPTTPINAPGVKCFKKQSGTGTVARKLDSERTDEEKGTGGGKRGVAVITEDDDRRGERVLAGDNCGHSGVGTGCEDRGTQVGCGGSRREEVSIVTAEVWWCGSTHVRLMGLSRRLMQTIDGVLGLENAQPPDLLSRNVLLSNLNMHCWLSRIVEGAAATPATVTMAGVQNGKNIHKDVRLHTAKGPCLSEGTPGGTIQAETSIVRGSPAGETREVKDKVLSTRRAAIPITPSLTETQPQHRSDSPCPPRLVCPRAGGDSRGRVSIQPENELRGRGEDGIGGGVPAPPLPDQWCLHKVDARLSGARFCNHRARAEVGGQRPGGHWNSGGLGFDSGADGDGRRVGGDIDPARHIEEDPSEKGARNARDREETWNKGFTFSAEVLELLVPCPNGTTGAGRGHTTPMTGSFQASKEGGSVMHPSGQGLRRNTWHVGDTGNASDHSADETGELWQSWRQRRNDEQNLPDSRVGQELAQILLADSLLYS
ncbi:unnamed protein product, partial [Discosporangium mesarthrocarpum]